MHTHLRTVRARKKTRNAEFSSVSIAWKTTPERTETAGGRERTNARAVPTRGVQLRAFRRYVSRDSRVGRNESRRLRRSLAKRDARCRLSHSFSASSILTHTAGRERRSKSGRRTTASLRSRRDDDGTTTARC